MANNAAPKSMAPQRLWLNKSTLVTTTQKINEITNRLSILRPGSSDAAEDAGFDHNVANVIKARAGECDSLAHESKELVRHYRETDRTAKTLCEASQAILDMDDAMSQSNIEEHAAIADKLLSWAIENKPAFIALLQSLGDELPPRMSETLKSMNFDVPDSQPLLAANKKIEELSNIRDENFRVWGQVQELQKEVQKHKDLLAEATDLAKSRDDTIASLTEDKDNLDRNSQKLQDKLKAQEKLSQAQGEELIKLTEASRAGEQKLATVEQHLDQSNATVKQLEERVESNTRSENELRLEIRSLESENQAQSWQLRNKSEDCAKAEQGQTALQAEVNRLQEYLIKVKNLLADNQQQMYESRLQFDIDKESYEIAAKNRNAMVKQMNDKRLSLDQDIKGIRDELSLTRWQRDQFCARLESCERALTTDRRALEVSNEEICGSKASSKKQEEDYQGLVHEMQLCKANVKRFLVGPDSIASDPVAPHINNMLADDGEAMVDRTKPVISDWELLPI
ncbi:hypothetical protein DER45DRAFT_620464 [Fusarium avenaceum]|nr:hypothetical protein DER45DRAFT_98694 [Fusarium avenaceum]KAH6949344.1 hypothetical protein DER45DRAFT_620464 [Fusarium avenaceum]